MTSITKTNQTFAPQTTQLTSLLESPFKTIPHDVVKFILFLTNRSENTRLVSRIWNALTLEATKHPTKQELKQTIRLINEKLNPKKHAKCIAGLAEIQAARQPPSDYLTTYVAVGQLFLIVKGWVIGEIRKLPLKERDRLQLALGDQLPDSMKDLFATCKLGLIPSITDFYASSEPELAPESVDLDTFFTLLQSYQPLTLFMRTQAVLAAVKRNNIGCVKLLLVSGLISDDGRGTAVVFAVCRKNIECVNLLLANGQISEENRGRSVWRAAETNNIECAEVLLDNGPISEDDRRVAIEEADKLNNQEFLQLLREPQKAKY
jgi:hypothetical protein